MKCINFYFKEKLITQEMFINQQIKNPGIKSESGLKKWPQKKLLKKKKLCFKGFFQNFYRTQNKSTNLHCLKIISIWNNLNVIQTKDCTQ